MRILLTGAKGQLGRSIRARLPEEWELIATDSQTLDITDEAAVLNMAKSFQPDVIINAAAFTAVDKAELDSEKAFAINASGTRNLAEAAQSVSARFIHVSTDYVFSGRSRIPYKESDMPNPQSVYGQSKLAGELLALAADPDTVVIRTAWVFSEYGQNFVKNILARAKAGEELVVVDDQDGCPTYAGDLAQVIIDLLQRSEFPRGILHYCGNRALSWHKFAQTILKTEAELNPNFVAPNVVAQSSRDLSGQTNRPAYSVLNCDKAQALGFAPSDWQRALVTVLNRLREQESQA